MRGTRTRPALRACTAVPMNYRAMALPIQAGRIRARDAQTLNKTGRRIHPDRNDGSDRNYSDPARNRFARVQPQSDARARGQLAPEPRNPESDDLPVLSGQAKSPAVAR